MKRKTKVIINLFLTNFLCVICGTVLANPESDRLVQVGLILACVVGVIGIAQIFATTEDVVEQLEYLVNQQDKVIQSCINPKDEVHESVS